MKSSYLPQSSRSRKLGFGSPSLRFLQYSSIFFTTSFSFSLTNPIPLCPPISPLLQSFAYSISPSPLQNSLNSNSVVSNEIFLTKSVQLRSSFSFFWIGTSSSISFSNSFCSSSSYLSSMGIKSDSSFSCTSSISPFFSLSTLTSFFLLYSNSQNFFCSNARSTVIILPLNFISLTSFSKSIWYNIK